MDLNVNENDCQSGFRVLFVISGEWLTNGQYGKPAIQNLQGFHRTGKKQLSQLKHAVYDDRSFATGVRVTGLSPQGGRLVRTLFLTLLHPVSYTHLTLPTTERV